MLKLRESADEGAFHLGDRRADVALAVDRAIKNSRFTASCSWLKIVPPMAWRTRHEHIRASLDQYTFIDREIDVSSPPRS